MGLPVMIMGESGSGKSASLRAFAPDEVGIINVSGKPLPFRSELKTVDTDDYAKIKKILYKSKVNTLVIDDSQYLMANEFMRTASIKGYDKFTTMGFNFWDLVRFVINTLPKEKIVYFLHHVETTDSGDQRVKTVGKLLNEKITLEGMFTIVLKAVYHDGNYSFMTRTNGKDTAKSPMDMFFTEEIDNDLKMVTQTIREYYGI